jgi:hypothetical protein
MMESSFWHANQSCEARNTTPLVGYVDVPYKYGWIKSFIGMVTSDG